MEEDVSAEQPRQYWSIDLDWFPQNNRSFSTLVRGCLCPACRREWLKAGSVEIAAKDLLATISNCCSKAPGFINGELPILESIFRLFLANRNQPLDLEALSQQLRERRGGNSDRTSPEILYRLLKSDRYYGLCQVEG